MKRDCLLNFFFKKLMSYQPPLDLFKERIRNDNDENYEPTRSGNADVNVKDLFFLISL